MVDTWEELAAGSPPDSVRSNGNGFRVLIAWLAAEVDPQLVAVQPVQDEPWLVTDECVDRDGNVSRTQRLVTSDEIEEIAEGIDDYLRDAGVPSVPPGLGVYLALPDGVDSLDHLSGLLLGDVDDRETTTPAQMAAALRPALQARYPRFAVDSVSSGVPTSDAHST
jgi:hypothetical protein